MSYVIDHVQLAMPPSSEATADTFYVELLGFHVLEKPATLAARGGRWYESGVTQIHLGVEPEFRASAKAHVALRVTHFDQLKETLAAAGSRVQDDHEIADVERFYTWDPFGNRLEIIRAA